MPGVALASNSGSGSERIRGVDAGAERGGLPQLALCQRRLKLTPERRRVLSDVAWNSPDAPGSVFSRR